MLTVSELLGSSVKLFVPEEKLLSVDVLSDTVPVPAGPVFKIPAFLLKNKVALLLLLIVMEGITTVTIPPAPEAFTITSETVVPFMVTLAAEILAGTVLKFEKLTVTESDPE